jgi:hypothetical protein
MTAREDLHAALVHWLGEGVELPEKHAAEAESMLDAYRTEVLAEAETKAREVVAMLWGDGTSRRALDRTAGARAVEFEIGALAAGQDATRTATPERCYVTFVDGSRCSKTAGHWTVTNQDLHTPAPTVAATP